MEIKIVGITTNKKEDIESISKADLLKFGGYAANICYTQKDWDEITKEEPEKTNKRIIGNLENHHHSVFGHEMISLYITGIPKLIAMLINNEHEYNTSEKSARYTLMTPSEKELKFYHKWITILESEINLIYPSESYLDEKRIHKLAIENARYMISVFTPTKMLYTTSLRQLNYIYSFTQTLLEKTTNNPLINALKPSLDEFITSLEKTGYIEPKLRDYRERCFSFITDDNHYAEQFGRSYSVNYLASFACVGQLERHRSLDYSISLPTHEHYYVPPILEENQAFTKEWLEDIASLNTLYPQGMLLNVNETGKYENFILKLQERLCTSAQLEICNISKNTLDKYIKALQYSHHIEDQKILKELLTYDKGARCMNGYRCPSPCQFKEGMNLTRKI